MAPLIKVKVINKVKGQFGTANQPKGPRWINEQSGHCNIRQVSKLFFTVIQWKGQFFKSQGHIGSYDKAPHNVSN